MAGKTYKVKSQKRRSEHLAKKSGKKKTVVDGKEKGKKTLHAKRKSWKEELPGGKERGSLNGIKDKKVTVVGLARSGVGAANLLAELGAQVTVTDIKPEDDAQGVCSATQPSVRLALGTHPAEIFLHADMLVVSPGVPLDIGPFPVRRPKVFR